MTTEPLLSVRQLGKCFGDHRAVDNVSFDAGAGQITALIGPSGCGKTTTLRMIAGFENPDHGEIDLHGHNIAHLPPERRGIGMVFQDYALFPHMNVRTNVGFGGGGVDEMLALVGMSDLGNRYPDELSGGQQQRVALARSFAAAPKLLLLDEPFSNLDPALRSTTRREIRRLLKAKGIGIIMVTHDQEEALSFADHVVVMDNGLVLQCGPPREIYDAPLNRFVAGFLGRTNFIDGIADGYACVSALGNIILTRPATGRVTLSIRPESIVAIPTDRDDAPVISGVEFKGHSTTYWIDIGRSEIQVDTLSDAPLTEGTRVVLRVVGKGVTIEN